jgi:hypothetical protein
VALWLCCLLLVSFVDHFCEWAVMMTTLLVLMPRGAVRRRSGPSRVPVSATTGTSN